MATRQENAVARVVIPDPQEQMAPAKALEHYRSHGCNLVVAADNLHVSSPAHRVDFQTLYVDPEPSNGDVFFAGSSKVKTDEGEKWVTKYALAKSPLERIALAAGVIWHPQETKLLGMDKDYISFQAVGLMRSPSGEPVILKGTKELYMPALEDEIRVEQADKLFGKTEKGSRKKRADYDDLTPDQQTVVDRAVHREMLQKRKHRMALVETGAKLRAIRSMGLKSAYTKDQLLRPFVIARIVPDPNHPAHRQYLRDMSDAMFGDPSRTRELAFPGAGDPAPGLDEHTYAEDADVSEDPESGDPSESEDDDGSDAGGQGGGPMTSVGGDSPAAADSPSPVSKSTPAGETSSYINQEAADKLIEYARQFQMSEDVLMKTAGAECGVTELLELTTKQYGDLRAVIQAYRP